MGETFGKYELIEKVAAGGMAEVFLAKQQGDLGGFTKEVAIKRLFPNLTEEQEIIDMFLDEGRIAARLNHPNIVQIYDLGMVEDFLYIAMEYVHGKDLRSILERGYNADNFIPIELAASVSAQVAAGLHYAHTRTDDDGNPTNIVHRDVSPQNVLLSMDGAVKICDFGIAKAEHRIGHTQAGQVKGKWSYMSPEQIETGNVDPRSDVFSLGIVLYEATTMTRLFRSETQFEALENILHGRVTPPTEVRAGYPAELERIVLKSLQREPAHRYQSAEEMQLDLENWLVQNQASTSTVHIARYMRNIFPELTQQGGDDNDTTGPMSVDEEHFQKVDEDVSRRRRADPTDNDSTLIDPEFDRDAAMAAAEEAAEAGAAARGADADSESTSEEKDVTDMDEDDLDAALDMALGATPSEARTTPSPAAAPAEEEPAPAIETPDDLADTLTDRPALDREPAEPAEPEPSPETDTPAHLADTVADRRALDRPQEEEEYDEAETVVQKFQSPTAEAEPEPEAKAEPEAKPEREAKPAPEPEPVATPAATQPASAKPASAGLGGERSEPPPADRSGPPPGGPPPAAASGTVPTGPPGGKKPSPARSDERRARDAFEPDHAPAEPIDDFDSSAEFKSGSKWGWVAIIGLFGAIAGIVGIYMASLDTGGSTMEKEAEKMHIDPDMLEVKVPDPPEKVMATLSTTPAEAEPHVVINGLLHEDGPGQIPLVKGETNEVVVFADGYFPRRLIVKGEASELTAELKKFEQTDPEAFADVNIVTEPRDALVYVDGAQVGTSPTTVTGLSTEHEHHVMIKKEGRFSYAGIIGLVKKSENLIETRLEKLDSGRKNYVEVIFSAIPRGSIVHVNGEQIGATKSFKNFDRNQLLMVEFTEKDSEPTRRYALLEGVGTMELRPFLKPMKREKGTISIYVEPMGAQLYVGANAYKQGPAANLEFPEGPVKVVLDTAFGRKETSVEVVPNTHTKYIVTPQETGGIIVKKKD